MQEEKIDCSFARIGKIKLAAKPEHYDKLARSQELLAANVDPDTAMVSRADLASEVGSDRYYGGLLFRKSAGMHVGRFVRGLAKAAARRGVEIHEHTPMTGLRPRRRRPRDRYPQGPASRLAGSAGERHFTYGAARLDSDAGSCRSAPF